MNKKILLPLLTAMLCCSCGTNASDIFNVKKAVTVSDDTYGILAKGLDASANIDYPKNNTKAMIFDPDSPAFRNMLEITKNGNSFDSSFSEYDALSFNEKYAKTFSTEISASLVTEPFSANVAGKFNKSEKVDSFVDKEERYDYWYYITKVYDVNIDLGSADIESAFSTRFLRELDGVDSLSKGLEFLNEFGTHVFREYTLGGKMELTKYFAKESSYKLTETEKNIAASIDANVNWGKNQAKVSASHTCDLSQCEQSTNDHIYSKIEASTLGGINPIANASDYFTFVQNIGTPSMFAYEKWSEQFTLPNPTVSIISTNKSFALWEIIDQVKYQNQVKLLKQAFDIMSLHTFSDNCSNFDLGRTLIDTVSYQVDEHNVEIEVKNDKLYIPDSTDLTLQPSKLLTDNFQPNEYSFVVQPNNAGTVEGNVIKMNPNSGLNKFDIILKLNQTEILKLNIELKKGDYTSGYGTESQPYLIANGKDLEKLLSNLSTTKGNYYKLINNIDLNGSKIYPSGGTTNEFAGVFDGNNKKITNFTFLPKQFSGGAYNLGLFGKNIGVIKNTILENCVFANNEVIRSVNQNTPINVGLLCAENNGLINNCRIYNARMRSTVKISDNGNRINFGFIAGTNTEGGTIKESCVYDSKMSINNYSDNVEVDQAIVSTGLIAGESINSEIIDSYSGNCKSIVKNTNKDHANKDNIRFGAIVGEIKDSENKHSKIQRCVSYSIDALNNTNNFGLIAGITNNDSVFDSCYFAYNQDIACGNTSKNGCSRKAAISLDKISNSSFDGVWQDKENGIVLIKHMEDYQNEEK